MFLKLLKLCKKVYLCHGTPPCSALCLLCFVDGVLVIKACVYEAIKVMQQDA
jgi:hypothetical protein